MSLLCRFYILSGFLLTSCVALSLADCILNDNCHTVHEALSPKKLKLCEPPNQLSLPPAPQFITQPSSQIVASNGSIASFKCTIISSPEYILSFSWEHNGEEINDVDTRFIINTTASLSTSTLSVVSRETSTEGIYRCVVHSQVLNYSITSRYGHLYYQRCSMAGWDDKLLPSALSNQNKVELAVAKGATTILECAPNTALSSPFTTWLRNNNATLDENNIKLPDGRLLVRNFDPSPEGIVSYKCLVVSLDCPQLVRVFNLRTSDSVPPPVAPSNQTTVINSTVSLYCITNSGGSRVWFKDAEPLGLGLSWSMHGPMNEVLVLSNVTMATAGEYSCVDSDNSTRTAHLTVLAPPTSSHIEAANYTTAQNTLTLPRSSLPYKLALTCTTNSPSQNTEMSFRWFFRGNPINATHPAGVVFMQEGPVLSVSGVEVFGSYQCVATNRAGSTSALLFVFYEHANPPSSITVTPDRDLTNTRPTSAYLYFIDVFPPDHEETTQLMYTVEAFIYRSPDWSYTVCTCNYTQIPGQRLPVTFSANKLVGTGTERELYIRAAAVGPTGLQSDFLPYDGQPNSADNCDISLALVPPPPPTGLQIHPVLTPNNSGWNVTLSWIPPSDAHYPSKLYERQVTIDCEGMEQVTSPYLRYTDVSSYHLIIPCSTNCNWTVVYIIRPKHLLSSSTQSFTTDPIRPTQPPVLINITRINFRDFIFIFTLPMSSVSCHTLTNINLYLADTDSPIYIPMSNCKLLSGPDSQTAGRYQCAHNVSNTQCWQALNVRVGSQNNGGSSPPSNSVLLPGADTDVLAHSSDLSMESTSDTITVSFHLSNGLDCLLSNRPYSFRVCIFALNHSLSYCEDLDHASYTHSFSELRGNTDYTITGLLSVPGVGNYTLPLKVQRTKVGVPSSPPENLSFPIEDNGELSIVWTPPAKDSLNGEIVRYTVKIFSDEKLITALNQTENKFKGLDPAKNYLVEVSACTSAGCGTAASKYYTPEGPTGSPQGTSAIPTWIIVLGVAVGVGVLLVIVTASACVICCTKKYRKRRNDYQLLNSRRNDLHGSNESMSDHDLVSIGPDGAAPSIHSEWTELDKLDKPDPVREKVLGWIAEVPSDQHSRDADAEMDHMEGSVSHFDSPRDSSQSEILVDVHENKSSKHEDNTTVEGSTNWYRSGSYQHGNERREDTQIMIQNEQQKELANLEHQKKTSPFGSEHFQTSPLEITTINPVRITDVLREIRMKPSDGNETIDDRLMKDLLHNTSEFITKDASLRDQSFSSQGYVQQSEGTHVDDLSPQQLEALITSDTSSVNKQDYKQEGCVEQNLQTGTASSNGYIPMHENLISQPSSAGLFTSNFTSHSSENLSQESSVFDNSDQVQYIVQPSAQRTLVSSGAYSTCSESIEIESNTDFMEGKTCYDTSSRCLSSRSSEGYVSAGATPATLDETFDRFHHDDTDFSLYPPPTNDPLEAREKITRHTNTGITSLLPNMSLGLPPNIYDNLSNYLNTYDLNEDVKTTMDRETIENARHEF